MGYELFCVMALYYKQIGCAKIWFPLNGDPNVFYVIKNNNCVLQF